LSPADGRSTISPAQTRGIRRRIEMRGRGEAIGLPTPLIRIDPERIVS
jgi:hypothetical protein